MRIEWQKFGRRREGGPEKEKGLSDDGENAMKEKQREQGLKVWLKCQPGLNQPRPGPGPA